MDQFSVSEVAQFSVSLDSPPARVLFNVKQHRLVLQGGSADRLRLPIELLKEMLAQCRTVRATHHAFT